MKIEEVLARRTDLSTFLVHLTRDTPERTAKAALTGILQDNRVRAVSPFGHAVTELTSRSLPTDSQRCVCFTETPLEHVSLLLGEIDGRRCHFQPYGIAITKKQGRKSGLNPVWYVDITPGHDWPSKSINGLIDDAIDAGSFDSSHIAKLAPFMEPMGSGPRAEGGTYKKEFWWEREWRGVGDFALPKRVIVLCPEAEFGEFKEIAENARQPVTLVDPRWSLEQIIAHLASFPADSIGPF